VKPSTDIARARHRTRTLRTNTLDARVVPLHKDVDENRPEDAEAAAVRFAPQ
jgi:hypothetical protein